MVRNAAAWTADLVAVLAATALAHVAVLELGVQSPLVRTALLAPVVLLGPGYALVSTLYPERREPGPTDKPAGSPAAVSKPSTRSLPPTVAGRVALAVAASLVLVASFALVAAYTVGIDSALVFSATTAATAGLSLLALARRANLDERARFTVAEFDAGLPFGARSDSLGRESGGRGRVANLALAVGVLALLGTTAFAATAAPADDDVTEFYLATPDGDGSFTADDYPREFPADDGEPVVARIGNHGGGDATYTVVATVQRVDTGDGGVEVLEQRELARADATVAAGETASVEHEPAPDLTGDDLRLVYFLYEGDAPATPSADSAHRVVHYGITVDGGR
ncbi:DUF1616 domain-containing protein [Halobacterium litoreum]|uniref:DUF1616 domain-containing protein n=1 Tax=Halobacterium litoreum TaxID=2039234 RepID=A0ABD5NBN5_9EURY|nr:DUF1616 domain-containing protein [Halobacterium litoreum]UHH14409.1 DUF1616 domain-containing protein [Halobacterium litoreum]